MSNTLTAWVYRFIKFWVRVFYPTTEIVGEENLPDGPCIIVGNHAQMNGPIACELFFPGDHYIWTEAEMMHMREVPSYAFKDFWSYKPGYIRWFYKILSYIIAPISVCIFRNAHCIGVYHDMRLISTFRETVDKLKSGANVIIFPEHDIPYNNLVWEFKDRFTDAARIYYNRTKKDICFVPMYVAPKLKKLYIGEPVRFNHEASKDSERKRLAEAMMKGITDIARGLPEHTVVPYPNIPKKSYPKNTEVRG